MQYLTEKPNDYWNETMLVYKGKQLLSDCSIKTQNTWFWQHLNYWDNNSWPPIEQNLEPNTSVERPDFNGSFETFLKLGYEPNLELVWTKLLMNLQIFGGIGTWEEIVSYSGENPKHFRKNRWINFYLFYDLLRIFRKGGRKGGRVFELGELGQKAIEYAVSH